MIWIAIIAFVGAIATILIADIEEAGTYFCGFLGGWLVLVFSVIVAMIVSGEQEPKPKPIDVYRGYTTLQITYEDSTAVDSTVVFKKEFRKEKQ